MEMHNAGVVSHKTLLALDEALIASGLRTDSVVAAYNEAHGIPQKKPLPPPKPTKPRDPNKNQSVVLQRLRRCDGVIQGSSLRYLTLGTGYAIYHGPSYLDRCSTTSMLLHKLRKYRKEIDKLFKEKT